MVSKNVVIRNTTGLYVKPAGELCRLAVRFQSRIDLVLGGTTANAKSLLSVLGACVRGGDELILRCDGTDEEEALRVISEAIEAGLGE